MARVSCLVVVGDVASRTSVGGVGVVASNMASCTIIGDSGMCAFYFVELVVQRESSWVPTRVGGVALLAVEGDIEFFVIGVSCLLVVGNMALCAGIRCAGIVSVMT